MKLSRKHINIFLTALVGQSSQGRTPTRPRDKRDKMAILLWNSTEKGRFVPGTGPILSRGGVPFVPWTVPVCPGHRPAENVYVYRFFFFPEESKFGTGSKIRYGDKKRYGDCSKMLVSGILFATPTPTYKEKAYEQKYGHQTAEFALFKAFGAIFCPDVCSYFCLVCGGRGSLAYFCLFSQGKETENGTDNEKLRP